MYALLCIVSSGFCNDSALTGFCNTSVRAVSIIAMFTGKRCSGKSVKVNNIYIYMNQPEVGAGPGA